MPNLEDIDLEERQRTQMRGALQNADRLNAYLSMSSIPEAAEAAQMRARQQELARKRRNDAMELGAAMQFKGQESELDRAAQRERNDADNAAAMARLTADNQAAMGRLTYQNQGRGGPQLSVPEQRKMNDQQKTFYQAGAAVDAIEGLDKDQTSSGITGWATNILKGFGLNNVAQGINSLAYDTNEKRARAMLDASVESFKRALTGANLTANEVGLSGNWDPSQAITEKDKVMRLKLMQEAINRNREALGIGKLGQAPTAAPAAAPTQSGGLSPSASKYYGS